MPDGTTGFSRYFMLLTAAAVIVSVLAGCRESEQGRPLSYQPGVYGGTPDQKLDQDRLRELRQRGAYQSYY